MNSTVKYFFALILVHLMLKSFAQESKEGSIWYFDYNKGVDFKFTPPKFLPDFRYFVSSHPSTICDSSGNLLFYTSGDSAWNRNHKPMPNGFGFNTSNTPIYSTSVIVPHPGDAQLYYIFNTNQERSQAQQLGLHYSVVDMSADDGMGAVIFKKLNFMPIVSPLMSVTVHADDKSYWVITHGWADNKFYAVHVTESGVDEPIVSAIGNHYGNQDNLYVPMQMKVSPDGTKIGVVVHGSSADLYDFNANNGSVSNFRRLEVLSTGGIEFSPNSELLYVSAYFPKGRIIGGISQLDVSSGLLEEINASQISVGNSWQGEQTGELQLAPNGKIYGGNILVGGQGDPNPNVVSDPNIKGLGCNFADNGLLLPRGNIQRFPLSVQSIFRESPSVPRAKGCKGIPIQIRVTSLGYADSLQWDFGDGFQNSFPYASGKIVNHVYAQTGEYTVKVKKYIGNLSREIISKVSIIERPLVNLGEDTILCRSDELLLDAGNSGANFKWSTGETTQQIQVSDENQYNVVVDNGVCQTSDVISVVVYDYPIVELGLDKVICDNDSITLTVPFDEHFKYQWTSGSTLPEISIRESGLYELSVSRGRCVAKDEVNVQFGQIIFSLSGTEIEVQFGEELNLEAIGTNIEEWAWNFGDGLSEETTLPSVKHDYLKSGDYKGQVIVSNQYGCSASSFFHVVVPEHLFISNVLTANNDNINDFFEIEYNGHKQTMLLIFDRWGKMIFSSQSLQNKWSAEGSDAGIYFYQLKMGQLSHKGWIQVIK